VEGGEQVSEKIPMRNRSGTFVWRDRLTQTSWRIEPRDTIRLMDARGFGFDALVVAVPSEKCQTIRVIDDANREGEWPISAIVGVVSCGLVFEEGDDDGEAVAK
jgi:hypothetical protein